jgi:hypothetical protein
MGPAPCAETQTATTPVLCQLHVHPLAVSEVSVRSTRIPAALDGVGRRLPRAGSQLPIWNRTNPPPARPSLPTSLMEPLLKLLSSHHVALSGACFRLSSRFTSTPRLSPPLNVQLASTCMDTGPILHPHLRRLKEKRRPHTRPLMRALLISLPAQIRLQEYIGISSRSHKLERFPLHVRITSPLLLSTLLLTRAIAERGPSHRAKPSQSFSYTPFARRSLRYFTHMQIFRVG